MEGCIPVDELVTTGQDAGDSGDMEIQQLVGDDSTRAAVRILPRRPTADSLGEFQHTNVDGRVIIQEASGFVTPIPRALSTTSLLGEAFLSSCCPQESRFVEEGASPSSPSHAQLELDMSPSSSLTGTATPPSAFSLQLSPPPLSPKLRQHQDDFHLPLAAAKRKGKLPPRQPCKDRSAFSSVYSRANSETSLLSALTMDTSQGQGHTDHEKRKNGGFESNLQQPILYDGEQKSESSCGFPVLLKPSSIRRRSSWDFACNRSPPRDVFLSQDGIWDKASDSTAFHSVSDSSAAKGFVSINSSDRDPS